MLGLRRRLLVQVSSAEWVALVLGRVVTPSGASLAGRDHLVHTKLHGHQHQTATYFCVLMLMRWRKTEPTI